MVGIGLLEIETGSIVVGIGVLAVETAHWSFTSELGIG